MVRVIIQWTGTARAGLAKLPKKVRRGLLDKANELREASDPRSVHKRLTGPLQDYYRICYARFRAIYRIDEEELPNGDVIQYVKVKFIAAGIRKEGDKNDIYRLAQKLVELGIIDAEDDAEGDEDDTGEEQKSP